MRIEGFEVTPVSVPYRRPEVTSFATFREASTVLVKLTSDTGVVGWGESVTLSDAASVEAAVETARPFLLGRDPWDKEAIAADYFRKGAWRFREMTGNFAFSGIDMALWDLCGKSVGQPVYRLLGGAMREEVDYFAYLLWELDDSAEADVREQCEEHVERGYRVFYLKVGVDSEVEEGLLGVVRETIGPAGRIRIDANEAWSVPEAARILNRWHSRYELDFVEAPVAIEPPDAMLDLKSRVQVPLCANEGLGRQSDVLAIIERRVADYLCFHVPWVGSIRRFHTLAHLAALRGLQVCKHSHPELGVSAAAGQQLLLAAPSATVGNQQHATMLVDDVVAEPLPTASGPTWKIDSAPGLGIEVDEEKVALYHRAYAEAGHASHHV